jgi:hypothetical protein
MILAEEWLFRTSDDRAFSNVIHEFINDCYLSITGSSIIQAE